MKSVELFAGAGGLGMGASLAHFNPARIIEWDRWCCDTISENRANGVAPVRGWPEPEQMDARDADFTDLEGKIELVTGGPPCQPFSLGGRHQANLDKRDMWPVTARAVREVKPKAFIFENVKGLTRDAFKTYFEYIKLQLAFSDIPKRDGESWIDHLRRLEREQTSGNYSGLKYNVVSEVLNAADYGIPQKRERVFIVGFRADLKIAWSFPKETHSQDALLWQQVRTGEYWERHRVPLLDRNVQHRMEARAAKLDGKPSKEPWLTVRDAIGDMPEPTLDGCASFKNHRLQIGARSYKGHTGSPMDEPAKTLKAGVHGVPGGENMLLKPNGEVRYFSVRESARLQTFPDEYELHGSWTEAMRQLGNAVPVSMALAITSNVAKRLKAH